MARDTSDVRSRVLFQENPFPMWVFDNETLQFLAVNDAAIAQYGYSREEFLTMRVTDIRPPDELPRLREYLKEPLAVDGVWRKAGQWRHLRGDGEPIEVDIIGHGLTFDGRPARMTIAVDVTERQRREERLEHAEERMRLALSASQLGIWDANMLTGVAYWSERCEEMHGLPPGTFGQTLEAFLACIHPDDRAAIQNSIDTALQTQSDVTLDYRAVWQDGTERHIASTAHFAFDERGVPLRGTGVAMDVTERHALESQLRQSQKMEAIGQLAGGIAHDFNNMLTVILGNAEWLLEGTPRDAQAYRLLDDILNAARGAASLTRQLLAFSRKQVLQPRVVHLGEIVGEIAPMLRRLLGESIDLRTAGEDLGRVHADAGQLQQVVVNLVLNARDAMPDGGQLTIETRDVVLDDTYARTHPGVRTGAHVMLAVTDTGHGIDEATRRRIFEPFFTTKAKGRGTGLGLATVHGVVRQSEGHIWVYSEVSRGTTFKVYLPQTTDAEPAPSTSQLHEAMPLGTETIVLVEDEQLVRDFALRALIQFGYTVHALPTPEEAIAFADAYSGRIHAIVTDAVLPDMNGRTMALRIQRKHPESRILYVSGYTDNAIVQHGVLEAGMWFLEKPFSAEALGLKLRQLLDDTGDPELRTEEEGRP